MIASLTGQSINVQQACRMLGVSQSGFYAWKDRPDPPRTLRRIWLAGEIADVHKASGGTYGANRVQAELRYGRGIRAGHNAIELIMREIGIKGTPTRRRHSSLQMRTPSEIELAWTIANVAVVQPDLARTASTVAVAQAGSVGLAGTSEADISIDHQHLLLNNDQAA